MKKWIFRVIAIAVGVAVAIAVITVIGMNSKRISQQYHDLSNKPTNSARQFKIPFGYITINSDGTVNIDFATNVADAISGIVVVDGDYNGLNPDDDSQVSGFGGNSYYGNSVSTPDYNLTFDDKELIDIFKSIGCSEQKAYGLLACYKACTELGMSTRETIGLLACGCCEGSPGLVQYGHTIGGKKSTNSSPLYLNTLSTVQAAINGNYSKDTGAGTAQWTNGRLETYAKIVSKYVNNSGTCDYKTLWKADYDMYKQELSGSYAILPNQISNHNSSVESVLVYSFFRYEAGFGYYNNSDKISDYSGSLKSYLDDRMVWANKLDAAFKSR